MFAGNSPLLFIDAQGLEKIAVTGAEYSLDGRYKYNFVEPAITKLKEFKGRAGDEQVTWMVMTLGYSDEDMSKFRHVAQELGVNLVEVKDSKELINYDNSMNKDVSIPDGEPGELSSNRSADPITEMSIFGHGYPGRASLGTGDFPSGELTSKALAGIRQDAFRCPSIGLYTCNAATPVEGGVSFAQILSAATGGEVRGYEGRTDYAKINPSGSSLGDKINRFISGFNTSGSQQMPQAGFKNGTNIPSEAKTFKKGEQSSD